MSEQDQSDTAAWALIMKIAWEQNVCVLCLSEANLSVEHIIPASIGGTLTCRFLCPTCNSNFGSSFEAKTKSAPTIRLAISNLSQELPELFEAIETGNEYFSDFGQQRLVRRLGKDGLLSEGKLTDGSLIVPEKREEQHLRRILSKDGFTEADIDQFMKNWALVPNGASISVGDRKIATKWHGVPAKQRLSGSDVSPLLLLKIAYEFMVLIWPDEALSIDAPMLVKVRRALRTADEQFASSLVSKQIAAKYLPFHGICLQDGDPAAVFQIRLFGKLAYLVTLPDLRLACPPVVYTHFLKSDEHVVHLPEGGSAENDDGVSRTPC